MEQKPTDPLAGVVRALQIIVFALAMGVVIFLMIVLFGVKAQMKPPDGGALLSLIALAFTCILAVTRLIVPGLMVSSACKKIAEGNWQLPTNSQFPPTALVETDEGKLALVFQMKTIVGSALLEGAAFFCIIAYMMEGQIYVMALVALLIIGILAGFPTMSTLTGWIERQMRRVTEIRDLPKYR